MVVVAVLLLPLLAALLMVTDRLEERLLAPVSERRRHAVRKRHLRLIRGGRADAGSGPERREADTAGGTSKDHGVPRHRAA
ncbi:hypothetical protein ABZT03_19825 [Streptomyces sp. NPDC005574]|uniref:hypothetical protein n=1 Tax=Streptomyces sp. NPDC005574 TaxID=3156891 RepID=UPI0033AD960A